MAEIKFQRLFQTQAIKQRQKKHLILKHQEINQQKSIHIAQMLCL